MVPPLTIRLFGPMLVLVGEEPLPRLRSRKALWLLALLCTRANRPVAREWLATTLWPDVDQAAAFANLRPVVSELRRALGDQGERVRSIDRNTVCLDLQDVDLDIERFDAAIKKGDFAQAADLYRGPLLEDCSEEWVPQERSAREADCLRALQALGEGALGRGEHEVAIANFKRGITLDPWRDAPRRGLMEALAETGDVNAALQTYRDFAHLLSSEAGTAPDASTTKIYTRLRNEVKRGVSRHESESAKPAPRVSGYLPHPLTELVGREDERLDLAARLRASRLVTLVGPGGIGKTRLATEVAHEVVGEHPDGVWLVTLEGFEDDRMVAKEVASTLEIADEAGRSLLQTLARALRDKQLLIVLDNCEHVLAASADLAATLLRDCGGIRILATSREPLGLTGERVWPVPPLASPSPESLPEGRATLVRVMCGYESVRLFAERAQAVQPSFEITPENARAVATICARLEGVPLALELAAARVRALTPEQVAERLDDGLRLLTGGRGTPAKRQQTLRATLDWSHDLLSSSSKILFRRMAAFADGWTLEAAEAVAGQDAADGLVSLVDKSLVVYDERRGRYRFLETMRQYAVERLEESGEREAIEERFQTWILDLAVKSDKEIVGPDQKVWAARLDAEVDNLRNALRLADRTSETGLALTEALSRYWYFRGRFTEGREHTEAALRRADPDSQTLAHAGALNGAGILAYAQGDLDTALRHWERCLAFYRLHKDILGISKVLTNLANIANQRRETARAVVLYEESLALRRAAGERHGTAMILSNLGLMRHSLGDLGRARGDAAESLALFREVGDDRMIAWLLKQMGDVAHTQADYGEARAFYEGALAAFRESKSDNGIAWTLDALSLTIVELRHEDAVSDLQEEALRLFNEQGDGNGQVSVALHQGEAALRQGRYVFAREKLKEALAAYGELNDPQGKANALTGPAELARAEGDFEEYARGHREALRLRLDIGELPAIATSLEGLALVEDAPRSAAHRLAAAESLRESIGAPLPNFQRQAHADAVAGIRERLGEAEFAAAWNEGCEAGWKETATRALIGA
ncbi:tetratricopeptide repeat protein [bacterium]|nr:MAG: tetratricopeptide repeat protein [bacterium]